MTTQANLYVNKGTDFALYLALMTEKYSQLAISYFIAVLENTIQLLW